MSFAVFFDEPNTYRKAYDFYSLGGSPKLATELLKYLEINEGTLTQVFVALYLYNNKAINEKLVWLSAKGVEINVFTMPIEGYDAGNPKDIIDIETRSVVGNGSKYELAKEIFTDHYRGRFKNFNLFFFPHLYLRSSKVKPFSRGNMPYSLHVKSFLFKHRNGQIDIATSSSNLAVRDLVKEENLIFVFDKAPYYQPALQFFDDLKRHCTLISDFNFAAEHTGFEIAPASYELNEHCGFMSPFYFDSSFRIEEYIRKILSKAKQRIIIVGQHVCPVDYKIDGIFHSNASKMPERREGLINTIIEKANNNIPVNIISQTFAGDNPDFDNQFRSPANKRSFIEFFHKINKVDNLSYYVNENCHSKYIIVDQTVLISTFNYTPTQFIYLDAVRIDRFIHNPGKTFKGIYAEVGQFVYITDPAVADLYVKNFERMISKKTTIKVK